MSLFSVYIKDTLIGYSELELGDAPMGVVFGNFIPNANYDNLRSKIVGSYGDQAHLELQVYTETGIRIPCIAVGIEDNTAEIPEWLQIEILGIPYPEYENIFPHHVQAYKDLFKE